MTSNTPGMANTVAEAPVGEALTKVGARVRLADYPATAAELRIVSRTKVARTIRALAVAASVPPLALIAFLIPPHGETFFLAVGLGIYMVYREASTRYVVQSFDGTCPRCGQGLKLKRGSRLTAARDVPCYGCHFHPTIEVLDGGWVDRRPR